MSTSVYIDIYIYKHVWFTYACRSRSKHIFHRLQWKISIILWLEFMSIYSDVNMYMYVHTYIFMQAWLSLLANRFTHTFFLKDCSQLTGLHFELYACTYKCSLEIPFTRSALHALNTYFICMRHISCKWYINVVPLRTICALVHTFLVRALAIYYIT